MYNLDDTQKMIDKELKKNNIVHKFNIGDIVFYVEFDGYDRSYHKMYYITAIKITNYGLDYRDVDWRKVIYNYAYPENDIFATFDEAVKYMEKLKKEDKGMTQAQILDWLRYKEKDIKERIFEVDPQYEEERKKAQEAEKKAIRRSTNEYIKNKKKTIQSILKNQDKYAKKVKKQNKQKEKNNQLWTIQKIKDYFT